MKLDIQLFGGRGASSGTGSGDGSSNIKMKKGTFKILKNKNGKDVIEKQEGRIFKYKGVEYGVSGSYNTGYNITHLKSGILVNNYSLNNLKAVKREMKNINKLVKNNKTLIQLGVDRFNKAKK